MFCTTVKLSLDATPQYNCLNTLPACQIFKICTIDVICLFQLLLLSTIHVVRRDLIPLHKKVPLALYSNLSSLDNLLMAYTQGRNM